MASDFATTREEYAPDEPTDSELLAAALRDPTAFATDPNGTEPARFGTGTGLDFASQLASAPATLQIEHVTIAPGGTFDYVIEPGEYVLGAVPDSTVTRTKWSSDGAKSDTLLTSTYPLHDPGPGSYTLTNASNVPVSIYLLRFSSATAP